ncbi:Putative ribonuclease H protein At1g65750 [Linum perenne]
MSVFFLSASLTKKMDSLVRNFFWSGSMSKKSIHWCNGSTFCDSKSKGGLGFKSFTDFNLAMLAKQGWRILQNPEALWVRLLKSIYFPKCDFLMAKKGSRTSWIWASIFKARSVVSLGAIKRVGDGSSIMVNYDPWIPSLPNFMTPFNGCSSRFVDEWINEESREWESSLFERFFSPTHVRAILAVPIGPRGMKDEWKWSFTNDGEFSVRSAYHAKRQSEISVTSSLSNPGNDKIWKWLWNLSLPPKIRFFLWRCVKDVLATKSNLFRRNCSTNDLCPICLKNVETPMHCLFNCAHAREVWTHFYPPGFLPAQGMSFKHWLFPRFSLAGRATVVKIAAVVWNIWKTRNNFIFKASKPSLYATGIMIENDYKGWSESLIPAKKTMNSPTNHSAPPPSPSFPPPRTPSLVIHCDGSFLKDSQEAAYGVVVSNSHGQVCDGRSGTFLCSSAMMAEAKAILEAINLAASRQVSTLILSD